ncbi:hypothetical protein Tco_0008847 [Tanacetum coccineum]
MPCGPLSWWDTWRLNAWCWAGQWGSFLGIATCMPVCVGGPAGWTRVEKKGSTFSGFGGNVGEENRNFVLIRV